MSRHLRRPLAVLLPLLLAPTLVSCGEEVGAQGETSEGLSALSIEGDVGTDPDVTWSSAMSFDADADPEVETLVEGDGPEVTAEDTVLVNYWVGNGYTESQSFSTYTDDGAPQALDLSAEDLVPVFTDPLVGQTVGSRVAVAFNAEEPFGGAGSPALGIGNQDPVVIVFDIMGPYDVSEPYETEGAAWTPDLVLDEDGNPEAMRFKGRPRPTGELRSQTVVEGDGPALTADDTVQVKYLGQVYAKAKPFDGNYDKPDFLTSPLSGLVEGWAQGLEGVPVGSRVVLAIPPDLGYGAEGNPDAGIKGTDTIYFLIDIVGAG